MSTTTIPAIRHSVTVQASPAKAFDLWVGRIAEWWPLDTHSIGQEAGRVPDTVVFEQRVGGRLFERSDDGEQKWADVLVFEPPHRFVIGWKVNSKWPDATEVEVTFTAEGDGTRVDIEHRGWERIGSVGPKARDAYEGGWAEVLGRYEEAGNR
ncbi:MAG TPA: SRPBCC family protein [Gaiellaceae bacterium]|nr:SRPBCC family protein [Gaiellaceae bacterium]